MEKEILFTGYFCKNQYSNSDEEVCLGGCCNLLLAKGVAYLCPYSVEDIFIKEENKKPIFGIENKKEGECKDFRISLPARMTLISKCD